MHIYKSSFLLMLALLFSLTVNSQIKLGKILDKAEKVISGEPVIDNNDIAAGLKQALDKGVDAAVQKLSAEDGYLKSEYKIEVSEDARKVISKLKMLPGFENIEEELTQKMNKAAELAATKATPIFVEAIKTMSFDDAMKILKGEDHAATIYLEEKSKSQLYDAFMPVIIDALDEVNARSYWRTAVNAYNKIPFVKKLNPELDDHVNTRALNGLFALIAVKEEGIRNDIDQRSTDLLRKVFAKQDVD